MKLLEADDVAATPSLWTQHGVGKHQNCPMDSNSWECHADETSNDTFGQRQAKEAHVLTWHIGILFDSWRSLSPKARFFQLWRKTEISCWFAQEVDFTWHFYHFCIRSSEIASGFPSPGDSKLQGRSAWRAARADVPFAWRHKQVSKFLWGRWSVVTGIPRLKPFWAQLWWV